MCGIVGMISRKQQGFFGIDLDIMENLLVLDTLRGLDSTGVFAVDKGKSVGIMKIASNPYHLFACDDWSKFRNHAVQQGRIIMGHNRKATQGAVNSNNAHPFHENNIVLIHNGTLRGDHKKMADVEVDSHAVAVAFNEKGAENVLPEINGAFAFVWWDIEKGKLFAIRNDERPLNIVLTDDLLILASEAWMPHALLSRHNRKVESTKELEIGKLYEFDLDGTYTTKDINIKKPVYSTNTTDYCGGNWSTPRRQGAALTCIKGGADTEKGKEVKNNPPPSTLLSQFKINDRIRLQILDYDVGERQTHVRVRGKVADVGLEPIDFVCNIPCVNKADVIESQVAKMADKGFVTGEISSIVSTNCGPSLYIRNLTPENRVTLHNGDISEQVWNGIVATHQCKHCTAAIFDDEAPFTVVEQSAPDVVTGVVCVDCVEDRIKDLEKKNEFQQRRADAVQINKRLSDQLAELVVDVPAGASSPTVH